MRTLCVVITFFWLVTLSVAQSSCNHEIVVNVRDSKGEFVPDLQASSFHAKVAGHEATVTSAKVFSGSNRVILVLDASGSMSGDHNMRRWKAIEGLTEEIVASAPAWTKLALLVFNAQTIRKVEFGHSRKELVAAIEQLPPAKGQTALWNSLLEADEMFGEPARGDAMVVLSDFGDNFSKTKESRLKKTLVGKGVRMFGIGIYDHYFATEEERWGPEELRSFAQETGGTTLITDTFKDAPSLLKQLFDDIGQFYVLNISPSAPVQKPERLTLSLLAADGKKNKGIVLSYPQHLLPCNP